MEPDYSVSPTPVVTLDSATGGASWGAFFTGAGGLLQTYAQYRATKSSDAIQNDGRRSTETVAGQPVPAWLLPVAVIGGLGLVVLLVWRK